MKKSFIILTDSGGIQEEAPFFNIPVLVMRNQTERQEGIKAGTSVLVGTDKDKIVKIASQIISDDKIYNQIAKAKNPFGDGKASERIVKSILPHIPSSTSGKK